MNSTSKELYTPSIIPSKEKITSLGTLTQTLEPNPFFYKEKAGSDEKTQTIKNEKRNENSLVAYKEYCRAYCTNILLINQVLIMIIYS